MIWNETQLTEELGSEGYKFFVSKAEPRTAACTFCHGTGVVIVPNDLLNGSWAKEGRVTNFTRQQQCWNCYEYVTKLTQFCKLRNKIPHIYRNFTLRTLRPYEPVKHRFPLERQQNILEYMRANPDQGYAFFGPPSLGKSVMTTALYLEAIWKETVQAPPRDLKANKYFPVWWITTKQMLDEHTDWSMHKNDPEPEFGLGIQSPTVTVEKIAYIRDHDRIPRLFLEEIDKVKETDARRANLFAIINAIHNYGGQLVINSNLEPREFADIVGDDLAWRIEQCCKKVNLFTNISE